MEDKNGDIIEGTWRDEPAANGLVAVGQVGSNRYSHTAAAVTLPSNNTPTLQLQ